MADLVERLRAHPNKFLGHWEDWAHEADTLMLEAAAALEAEASKGERDKQLRNAPAWNERLHWLTKLSDEELFSISYHLPNDLRERLRAALIPEAPVREGK